MRRPIETAPKDGTVVILEDDATETFELAHWSAEDDAWVGEGGMPCRIDPIQWHPVQRSALQQEVDEASALVPHPAARAMALAGAQLNRPEFRETLALAGVTTIERNSLPVSPESRKIQPVSPESQKIQPVSPESQTIQRGSRRFAGASIGAAMVLVSLLGMYSRNDIVANIRANQAGSLRAGTESDQTAGQICPLPPLPGAADKELTESVAPKTAISELQATLVQERAKSAALEIELKNARRELVTQAVRVAETSDEARQNAKNAADLQQTLAREAARTLELQNERARATVRN